MVVEKRNAGATTVLSLRPVVPLDATGKPAPKNGEEQLMEAARQVVIAETYPEQLGPYLTKRLFALDEPDWQTPAKEAGLDPVQVEELLHDQVYAEHLIANSIAFADLQVQSHMAFVRDNQQLVPVMNRQNFLDLLSALP